MKSMKSYDCVQMKNQIQAELLKRWQGLSDKEIKAQIRRDLKESKSPTAALWRRLTKRNTGRRAKCIYA